jgi:hypothetical protein
MMGIERLEEIVHSTCGQAQQFNAPDKLPSIDLVSYYTFGQVLYNI